MKLYNKIQGNEGVELRNYRTRSKATWGGIKRLMGVHEKGYRWF